MTFCEELVRLLLAAQFADHDNNYDFERFGPLPPQRLKTRVAQIARAVARRCGFWQRSALRQVNHAALRDWTPLFPDLEWLYGRLDQESRQLLVQVVALNLMGPRAIRLPLSTPQYWKRLRELRQMANPTDSIPIAFHNWRLFKYDLRMLGYPLYLYTVPLAVMSQFELGQYSAPSGECVAVCGDVVIDAGGCYGDSALYFACKTGESGKVYSFEFVPSNIEVMCKNLQLNPDVAKRVEIVQRPLWSESNKAVFVDERGPASQVGFVAPADNVAPAAVTISVDDFVAERRLETVDFIKMDIEGAEFMALQGAVATLRRFRPKLAICVYHSPLDYVRLARWIDGLGLEYRFQLGHFTTHREETVLFATAKGA